MGQQTHSNNLAKIKQYGPAALTLLTLLAAAFWVRHRYLWVDGITYDEGHWLMFGVLANAGYAPYSVTFVGIPPLALLVIQLSAALFEINQALRYPMMLFSLLGVATIFVAFRPWQSRTALLGGLLAASILAFAPEFLVGSATIMAEVPAISLAIVSFVLALEYQRGGRWGWLLASGAAFGLSLALKLFAVFLPGVIGGLLLVVALTTPAETLAGRLRRLVVGGLVWGLGALLPWLLFALMYDVPAMFREIFLFRLSFRELNYIEGEANFSEHLAAVGGMLLSRWPLLLGAAAGSWLGWRQRRPGIWLWVVWLVLATLPLIWQAPLRGRYVVMLLPPLAVLSGYALAVGLAKLSSWLTARLPRLRPVLLAAALAALFVAILRPAVELASVRPFIDSGGYIFDYLTTERQDGIDYLRASTFPGDCIVTDDQRLAFAVGRLVPAHLSETAVGRLAIGWLTGEDIIREIETHQCPATVYVAERFDWHLPDLPERLRELYFLEIIYTNEYRIFTAKKDFTRPPSQPLDVTFGQVIALRGIDVTPGPWQAGQPVQLATYWAALQPPPQGYKIFLQLRDEQGQAVASYDHFPFEVPGYRYHFLPDVGGEYEILPAIEGVNYRPEDIARYPQTGMVPTNFWPVGSTIREVVTLDLPANLSAGGYQLLIGLYDPQTDERLPLSGETAHEFTLVAPEVKN